MLFSSCKIKLSNFHVFPLLKTQNRTANCIAWEQGKGKERGRDKREHVGMAKDFDFQMPVIYVQQQQLIWHKLNSY